MLQLNTLIFEAPAYEGKFSFFSLALGSQNKYAHVIGRVG
jgi:hypothetical protein